MFNLFHSVFDLLASSFSIKFKYSDFLQESIVITYIRMCYFNFVKIYSHISNNEIVRINKKVVEKLNEEHNLAKSTQSCFKGISLDNKAGFG